MKPAIAIPIPASKSCGPGRPKDLEKRAAILDAAKRLFPTSGFEGTSMDAIAADAGVSKLAVYSHFRDKETLFIAAIRVRCEEQVPETLFDVDVQDRCAASSRRSAARSSRCSLRPIRFRSIAC
jgi:AcrR family transcriptional regulator